MAKSKLVKVNEKIEEIQNEKGLTIFVNTLAQDEGFAISDPERAMILNLKKGDKEVYLKIQALNKELEDIKNIALKNYDILDKLFELRHVDF